jgi:geranylgeranyl reductase family protein
MARPSGYDVIIVGAGPAGAAAGRHLARRGVKTLILDKARFPRVKPCGGGLTYRILQRFPDLERPLAPLILNRVSNIEFYSPDLSCLRYTYNEPITLMIRRSAFDAMLLEQCQQAGAAVIAPARVQHLTVTDTGVVVSTAEGQRFRAQALIGADGAQGLIARQAGLRPRWTRAQFVVSTVTEQPHTAVDWRDHETISILFGFSGLGYGWVFPKRDSVNIGVANFPGSKIKPVYRQFLEVLQNQGKLGRQIGDLTTLRGGLIPMAGPIACTQTDRILVCGDAAGFVHGVTGEGIYYAMVSGELAAKTLVAALARNELSAAGLAGYQAAWQAEIGAELAASVHIQHRLHAHLGLINVLVRMVNRHEGLKKEFTDYFMGKIAYSQLKQHLIRQFLPQYLKLQISKWMYSRTGRQ